MFSCSFEGICTVERKGGKRRKMEEFNLDIIL